jgi:hypothetical protein
VLSNLVTAGSVAANYAKVFAANSTGTSVADPADSTTAPSTATAGVLDLRDSTGRMLVANLARFEFYGTDAANETFEYAIFGWASNGTSWSATKLAAGVATLGTKTGVAAGGVLNTELYADTLTVATGGEENVTWALSSPADNTKAWLLLDCAGFPLLQVKVKIDTGTPSAAANLLWARV